MADLGRGQEPIVMPSYPHMMPLDADVWTRFLSDGGSLFSKVWYDVHVGKGIVGPIGVSSNTFAISQAVGRKRIDVVASVAGGYWIVEVKPRGSMQAVGQVLCYTKLFLEEYTVSGEVRGVIICDQADPDLLSAYDDFGVGVILAGGPEGET